MLPQNLPLGKILYNSPQPIGVSGYPNGGGSVPDSSRQRRLFNTYKSQARRWINAKQASNKSLVKVINKEDPFSSCRIPTLLEELEDSII